MLIEYVGHSCFYLTTKAGVRIIIDPYDNSIGLAAVDKQADIALISHHHFDHGYLGGVHGDFVTVDAPGEYEICGVTLKGVPLFHDEIQGKERGEVVAFTLETDGMRILHMGDVGEIPSQHFFEQAGKIDILMIPVGGVYTVDARQAIDIMERLNPNITIPMHYKTTHLTLPIAPVNEFVMLAKETGYDISRLGESKFEITADNLKKRDRVLLMENSF